MLTEPGQQECSQATACYTQCCHPMPRVLSTSGGKASKWVSHAIVPVRPIHSQSPSSTSSPRSTVLWSRLSKGHATLIILKPTSRVYTVTATPITPTTSPAAPAPPSPGAPRICMAVDKKDKGTTSYTRSRVTRISLRHVESEVKVAQT